MDEGVEPAVDPSSLVLEAIVYAGGGSGPTTATPFKLGHDFALFASDSIDQALAIAEEAAAGGAAVGVGIGDVLLEDGDRFGMPVVIAARLAGVAGPGEILCDSAVALVAPELGFDDGGSHQLKGLPEPVAALRPVGARR